MILKRVRAFGLGVNCDICTSDHKALHRVLGAAGMVTAPHASTTARDGLPPRTASRPATSSHGRCSWTMPSAGPFAAMSTLHGDGHRIRPTRSATETSSAPTPVCARPANQSSAATTATAFWGRAQAFSNGEIERYNRPVLEDWAYAQPCRSGTERREDFGPWLHSYDHHRGRTALKGSPPASRVPRLTGQYT